MLSGINGLVLRIRDRTELLRETCRLAVSVGGYSVAIASSRCRAFSSIQPMAWSGVNDEMTEKLRAYVAESVGRESSVIARAVRTGKEFVCNNTARSRPRRPSIPSCCIRDCCRLWCCRCWSTAR